LAEGLRLHADQIFFACACMTLAATFYAVIFLPDSVLRLALWILTHSAYRIRVEGRDNVPDRGRALFVLNDLTLLDAIFLAAATDRPIRFVADAKPFARTSPLIRRALRITRVTEDDEANGFSGAVSTAIASGEVVCLAGRAADALLEAPESRHRFEEHLRETGTAIVGVSVSGAESGPLRSEDGHLQLMASHPRGHVRIKFRAPMVPSETEALGLSKPAPALRFSSSQN
jgi:Acyltransferase